MMETSENIHGVAALSLINLYETRYANPTSQDAQQSFSEKTLKKLKLFIFKGKFPFSRLQADFHFYIIV